MVQISGTQQVKLYVTEHDLAEAVERVIYAGNHGGGLYENDGVVYANDSYGPWEDELVSKDPDDIILLKAARILKERWSRKQGAHD